MFCLFTEVFNSSNQRKTLRQFASLPKHLISNGLSNTNAYPTEVSEHCMEETTPRVERKHVLICRFTTTTVDCFMPLGNSVKQVKSDVKYIEILVIVVILTRAIQRETFKPETYQIVFKQDWFYCGAYHIILVCFNASKDARIKNDI